MFTVVGNGANLSAIRTAPYSATEKKTSLSEKSVSRIWSIILGQQSAIERKVWSRPHTFASIDQETNLTAGVSKAIERSI